MTFNPLSAAVSLGYSVALKGYSKQMEVMRMDKIATLNELDVIDYSCSGGECEYVTAENSIDNRSKLLESGFTEQQIKEASDSNNFEIDLSYLAFNYANAEWWHVLTGFSNDPELDKKRLPIPHHSM